MASAHQLPSSHCRRSSKVVSNGSTLLPVIQAPSLYTLCDRRDVTWSFLVYSSVFPFLMEISRKGLHFLESSICRQGRQIFRQNGRQVRDPEKALAVTPCLTL
ncbi:hypothetical protein AVEN_274543-1 [Araneus ventricosus]|uniref:Uncharacterized protein n=1 Tax=Araneus ventricosus TaxID=182803 RepID=A0A4Y2FG25_ARAVE|nr:hypothetical protein AVEN_274543-1 [Araneus ventricosus]